MMIWKGQRISGFSKKYGGFFGVSHVNLLRRCIYHASFPYTSKTPFEEVLGDPQTSPEENTWKKPRYDWRILWRGYYIPSNSASDLFGMVKWPF